MAEKDSSPVPVLSYAKAAPRNFWDALFWHVFVGFTSLMWLVGLLLLLNIESPVGILVIAAICLPWGIASVLYLMGHRWQDRAAALAIAMLWLPLSVAALMMVWSIFDHADSPGSDLLGLILILPILLPLTYLAIVSFRRNWPAHWRLKRRMYT